MKDYYSTLGLDRGASDEQIKSAYRKLAMKHHPDRGGDPKIFQELQEAYNTLGDPGKRSEYDNPQPQMHAHFHQQGPFANSVPPGMEDIFNIFGGGFGPFFRQQQAPRNRNIQLQTTINLEDVYTGKELVVTINLPSGREQMLNVKIPPGIQDGINLRLANMGDDSFPGVPRGDVLVTINVAPHHKFIRQGDDLMQEISISCIDAILGKEVVIDTIDGRQFTGSVPAGTQPDSILGIGGQGLPNMNHPQHRGRMLLKIKMFVPTLSDQQKQILQNL